MAVVGGACDMSGAWDEMGGACGMGVVGGACMG